MVNMYTPLDKELAGAREHLEYEIRMLVQTATGLQELLQAEAADAKEWCARYAFIEAFLIHARNLIDFLYKPPSKKDNVLAEHFLEDPTKWIKVRSQCPDLLTQTKKRANKRLAHLAYTRVATTAEDKQWRFGEIAMRIVSGLDEFYRAASSKKLGHSLQGTIREAIDSLPKTVTGPAVATTTPRAQLHTWGFDEEV